jgi:hypothetical protein
MDGIDHPTLELANRDYRDGEIKDDAVPKALPVPQMHSPAHSEPSPPTPAPGAAQTQEKPQTADKPLQVAKQESETPLSKMIEEMDREAVRLEVNRLPLEIRKPGDPPKTPPQPTDKSMADDPPAPKAAPVAEAPTTSAGKPAKDAFTPFTRTAAVKGTISNRGSNAVDAESTPLGIYMRSVTGAVEQKWHRYRLVKKDAVTYGSLKVRFYVAKDGKPEDLRIISDPRNADPRMADFTLRAIQDAEIPPIPDDLLPMLNEERVMIEYDVLIY